MRRIACISFLMLGVIAGMAWAQESNMAKDPEALAFMGHWKGRINWVAKGDSREIELILKINDDGSVTVVRFHLGRTGFQGQIPPKDVTGLEGFFRRQDGKLQLVLKGRRQETVYKMEDGKLVGGSEEDIRLERRQILQKMSK